MPTPRKGEKKNDFMKRCVPQVVNEGKESDQAVAICNSLWENRGKKEADEAFERFKQRHKKEFKDYSEK
jgi:hypothetical protein